MCSMWYILPYNINSMKHAYVNILKYEPFKKEKFSLQKTNKIKSRVRVCSGRYTVVNKTTRLFKSALRANRCFETVYKLCV